MRFKTHTVDYKATAECYQEYSWISAKMGKAKQTWIPSRPMYCKKIRIVTSCGWKQHGWCHTWCQNIDWLKPCCHGEDPESALQRSKEKTYGSSCAQGCWHQASKSKICLCKVYCFNILSYFIWVVSSFKPHKHGCIIKAHLLQRPAVFFVRPHPGRLLMMSGVFLARRNPKSITLRLNMVKHGTLW